MAEPLEATDVGVEVFCALLRQSLQLPPARPDLSLPQPRRRGGASAGRAAL